MPKRISSFTALLTLTILLAGSTIILSRQLLQPTGSFTSKAAEVTSTGYIPPVLTADQKTTAESLTSLYSLLPVNQPSFKITFDYRQDKYLITFIGDEALAQKNFQSWLSVNKFSSLYPAYFTFTPSNVTN